jgi:hypothetical protein
MKLGEFLEKFIDQNSLIRLVHKERGGYKIVLNDWNDVSMGWQVQRGMGKNRHYINNEVINICCILTGGSYSEAINIVIEELEKQPFIEEVIDKKNSCLEIK